MSKVTQLVNYLNGTGTYVYVIPSSVLLTTALVVANPWKEDVNSLNAVGVQKRVRLPLASGMCYAWLGGAIRESLLKEVAWHCTPFILQILKLSIYYALVVGAEDPEVTEVLALCTCWAGIEERLKL